MGNKNSVCETYFIVNYMPVKVLMKLLEVEKILECMLA
jgi:hypothetical protein